MIVSIEKTSTMDPSWEYHEYHFYWVHGIKGSRPAALCKILKIKCPAKQICPITAIPGNPKANEGLGQSVLQSQRCEKPYT
jgi:hypothetical protein